MNVTKTFTIIATTISTLIDASLFLQNNVDASKLFTDIMSTLGINLQDQAHSKLIEQDNDVERQSKHDVNKKHKSRKQCGMIVARSKS
jgi:hypothetical protein